MDDPRLVSARLLEVTAAEAETAKRAKRRKIDKETEKARWLESFTVIGYGCRIFYDTSAYEYMEAEKQLIPWMGNEDLLLDRYDVRNMVEDYEVFKRKKAYSRYKPTTEELEEEQELDEERYRDFFQTDLSEAEEKEEEETTGSGTTIGFVYESEQPVVKDEEMPEEVSSKESESVVLEIKATAEEKREEQPVEVPPSLVDRLPETRLSTFIKEVEKEIDRETGSRDNDPVRDAILQRVTDVLILRGAASYPLSTKQLNSRIDALLEQSSGFGVPLKDIVGDKEKSQIRSDINRRREPSVLRLVPQFLCSRLTADILRQFESCEVVKPPTPQERALIERIAIFAAERGSSALTYLKRTLSQDGAIADITAEKESEWKEVVLRELRGELQFVNAGHPYHEYFVKRLVSWTLSMSPMLKNVAMPTPHEKERVSSPSKEATSVASPHRPDQSIDEDIAAAVESAIAVDASISSATEEKQSIAEKIKQEARRRKALERIKLLKESGRLGE